MLNKIDNNINDNDDVKINIYLKHRFLYIVVLCLYGQPMNMM